MVSDRRSLTLSGVLAGRPGLALSRGYGPVLACTWVAGLPACGRFGGSLSVMARSFDRSPRRGGRERGTMRAP
eukprot:scaffold310779_cov32-Tisochrysis_lutea.AAC.1